MSTEIQSRPRDRRSHKSSANFAKLFFFFFLHMRTRAPELFLPSESVVAPVITERHVSSAVDFARKVSVCSSRAKALAPGPGQDLPAELQTPSLRPRTPAQPFPHYPWQPKGECLSSTKVRRMHGSHERGCVEDVGFREVKTCSHKPVLHDEIFFHETATR